MDVHESIEKRRHERFKSRVRVKITYGAALFLFAGSAGLIIWLMCKDKPDIAVTVFNTVLPVATGIITYWFSTRSNRNGSGGAPREKQNTGAG